MTLYIVGAGMAGLLAANMLRKHGPVVLERSPDLPNNHSAVLRFRTNVVSEVLGIPFRRVTMMKTTLPWMNPVADAMAYAKKNLGKYESDRSISRTVESAERWVAPPDLIARMAESIDIRFGEDYRFNEGRPKVISTVPMPALMKAIGYDRRIKIAFRSTAGINAIARVDDCDAFVTINVPHPMLPYSRVSVTGDILIVEYPLRDQREEDETFYKDRLFEAADLLGINGADIGEVKVKYQQYQKIAPIDDVERKNFIHYASSVKGVAWQLGRFATWRPGLLLDDLIKDVRLIERWMASPTSAYEMEMHRV